MSELPLSGERVIEDAYRGSLGMYAIYLMHVASYRFAQQYASGRRVLDLGCGSGYGSAMVADVANNVIAVDISPDAISYAAANHARANLHHQLIRPGQALPFADASFDVVLSFQVIEHVSEDAAYIEEARRVLRDDGVLIVITPNRSVRLLPGQKPWNRWHLREYDSASLANLFAADQFDLSMHFMTASERIAALEMKRYRRLKWSTLPCTLPFVPDALRLFGLNMLHGFAPKPRTGSAPVLDLQEREITIGGRSEGALNLVAVAKKKSAPRVA